MKLYNPKIMQVQNMHVICNIMQKIQNHNLDAYFWMLLPKLGMSGQQKQQNIYITSTQKEIKLYNQKSIRAQRVAQISCVPNFKNLSVAIKYRDPQKVWQFSKTLQPNNCCLQQWCVWHHQVAKGANHVLPIKTLKDNPWFCNFCHSLKQINNSIFKQKDMKLHNPKIVAHVRHHAAAKGANHVLPIKASWDNPWFCPYPLGLLHCVLGGFESIRQDPQSLNKTM